MSRKTATVKKLLDAFEDLLVDEGERSATLDSIAERAGVSKGGLTHHFSSKDDLVAALFERLWSLVDEDTEVMRADPSNAATFYIKTSAHVDSPLERCHMAVSRLAQGSHPEANQVLMDCRSRWFEVLSESIGNEDMVRLIMLVGDGVYYNAALAGSGKLPRDLAPEGLDRVVKLVQTVKY